MSSKLGARHARMWCKDQSWLEYILLLIITYHSDSLIKLDEYTRKYSRHMVSFEQARYVLKIVTSFMSFVNSNLFEMTHLSFYG